MRDYSFIQKTGCYSCFDLIPDFEKIDKESQFAEKILRIFGYFEQTNNNEEKRFIKDASHMFKYKDILMAWLWDGDGHLIVSDGKRTAQNTDCKKDYTWQWVK